MLTVALVAGIVLLYVAASRLAHRPLPLPGVIMGSAVVIWLGYLREDRRR